MNPNDSLEVVRKAKREFFWSSDSDKVKADCRLSLRTNVFSCLWSLYNIFGQSPLDVLCIFITAWTISMFHIMISERFTGQQEEDTKNKNDY